VAADLAVESPPDGLILQSTFTSARDMARLHYPVIPAAFVPDAYKTAHRVAQIRAPTLFIHGESDRVVPVQHAVELHRIAPGPKRLERVPGADHNDVLDAMGPRYGQLLVEWVESWTRPIHAEGGSAPE
jgi:pimeloyl-ACP methyl ester carboxylesterase